MTADMAAQMERRCFKCMRRLSEPGAVCTCGYNNRFRSNAPGFLQSRVLRDQYFVGMFIGRGGFGITYIGYDMINGHKVAIKEYFPEMLVGRDHKNDRVYVKDPEQVYQFEQGREKALEEVRMLKKLKGLRNIVDVYEAVQENNTVYIIMEYIDGMALDKLVERRGALPPPVAFSFIRDIISTVAQMQEKHNLVHGDISPDNIMLRSDKGAWVPVLVDFGAAQQVQEEVGTVDTKIAKQYYSAPELLNSSGRVNKTTDGFSLCATLYFLLAGEMPKGTIDRYMEELPSIKTYGVNIGPKLEEAMIMGMALKRNERYENANELLKAFENAVKTDKKSRKDWGMEISAEGISDYLANRKRTTEEGASGQTKRYKKNLSKDGTKPGKNESKRKMLVAVAATVALAAAAAVFLIVGHPFGGADAGKPDLVMVMKEEGVVLSWDTPDVESYDVYLRSSDSSAPIRYNNTRAKNIMIPNGDLSDGLHFDLEVTAYYKNGSTVTVSEGFDIG